MAVSDSRPGAAGPDILVPAVAAIGIACGVTVLLVTVFNYLAAPIAADLHVSRAGVAGALSLHLAMLIFSLPVAGLLADRYGARATIAVSAVLFGAALCAASRVTDIRALYVAFAVAGIVGAGASPISYARAIVHRFVAHRGLALGIALAGTGLGGILLPMIAQPLVVHDGWRVALLVLGGGAAAIGLGAALLVGDERALRPGHATVGYDLRQAAGTKPFWVMTLAFGVLGIALSGFVSHLTEFWAGLGLSPEGVPRFQAMMGLATIAGRLVGGALMDRIPAKLVGAFAAAAGAAGLLGLAAGAQGMGLAGVALAVGLCTGTESDVISYLSSRYFGLREFARIYALQGAFFMIGFAVGPLGFALAMGGVGVRPTLLLGAGLLLTSALLLLTLRSPPPLEGALP